MANGNGYPTIDPALQTMPGIRNAINPMTINSEGSFVLTQNEAEQYGYPFTQPDILVRHFDMQDIGEQRAVIDAGLVEAAMNDRQAQQSLEMPDMTRSRHARAAAIRRALPNVEIMPSAGRTVMGKLLLINDAVSIPIYGENVLCRVTVSSTCVASFTGNALLPAPASSSYAEGNGFLMVAAGARLFFCDGQTDITIAAGSANLFFSVEFWSEII